MPDAAIVDDASELVRLAGELLEKNKDRLNLPDLRIQSLDEFLRLAGGEQPLDRGDKEAILLQAETLFRNFYPHLPFKKKDFPGDDPFVAIEQVRAQLDTLSTFDFHICMLLVFATVHDVHTSYTLPAPYAGAVAFLPFQARFVVDGTGGRRLVVTKVMATSEDGEFEHDFFGTGAEILGWNRVSEITDRDLAGIGLEMAARSAAQLQPGANPDAELSRGVARMTLRPLSSIGLAGSGTPPFRIDCSVAVDYAAKGEQQIRKILFPWSIATGLGTQTSFAASAFSISDSARETSRMYNAMYKSSETAAKQGVDAMFDTELPDPDLLKEEGTGKRFGYLRIKDFGAGLPGVAQDQILTRFKQILEDKNENAPDGLILDIRGNPGGQIQVAERMLQMLTPRTIEPVVFRYARTAAIDRVIEHFRNDGAGGDRSEFLAWLETRPEDDPPIEDLTAGRPLTVPTEANDVGQVYQGPVVLLIDALTYSAADMFAAGFQDHEIGEVIGVDSNTGGGGANLWRHEDLRASVPPFPDIPLAPLPREVRMSLAIRRCERRGRNAGMPIEDIGVRADLVHQRTQDDLFLGNRDLVQLACRRLAQVPVFRVHIQSFDATLQGVNVRVETANVGFLEFRLDGALVLSAPVPAGGAGSFFVPNVNGAPLPKQLTVEGYTETQEATRRPAAAARAALRGPRPLSQRAR
ncbi:MAG: S41 family peptidase [Bryobacterales bacterium]|nr:S41 family peptidase [Bryobacterales bacterium]